MADDHKDDVGAKVSALEVSNGIDIQQGNLMFPAYDPNNFQKFVTVQPDNTCKRQITLDFFVNFAVLATDTGNVDAFLDLAGAMIQIDKGGPSPVTVINGVRKVIHTLGDALQKDASGHQEFRFPVHLCCHQRFQPFRVQLEADTRLQITTKSENDHLSLDMHLRAHTAKDDKNRTLNGKERANPVPVDYSDTLTCSFITDGDFEVVVWFNEACHVNWEPGSPSIAMIRFDHLRIIVETNAECKEGSAPPNIIPQGQESQTKTPSGSNSGPQKK